MSLQTVCCGTNSAVFYTHLFSSESEERANHLISPKLEKTTCASEHQRLVRNRSQECNHGIHIVLNVQPTAKTADMLHADTASLWHSHTFETARPVSCTKSIAKENLECSMPFKRCYTHWKCPVQSLNR